MSDVAFSIGTIDIKWYSLLILFGVVFAYFIIMRESKRLNVKTDFMFNLLFWALMFGILGARIYYVIFNFGYYSRHLLEIIEIWNGGLAIHGGIIAGLIAIIIYCKKYNVRILKVLDIIVPALIIAQAIGRWGNFFNHEAFGSIVEKTTLESLKIIPKFIIDNMYIDGSYHLPMFYFESILCLIGFIIMLIIRRTRYVKTGQILSFYLLWYGIVRYIVEIFRTDSLMFFGIKAAQLISIIMIVIGFYILSIQRQKTKLEDLYNEPEKDINF